MEAQRRGRCLNRDGCGGTKAGAMSPPSSSSSVPTAEKNAGSGTDETKTFIGALRPSSVRRSVA